MKVLDLFSGSKSLEKICKLKKWEYTTLDNSAKLRPDILVDILEWNYRDYKGEPDIIWASPPCTEYSKFNNALPYKTPNIEKANKLVEKTLEIIEYLKPKYWVIENPQTGKLKDQPFMRGIPYKDVTYCKYGKGHRKQTRLWTNIKEFEPRPLCSRGSPCAKYKRHDKLNKMSWSSRAGIPEELVESIFKNII